MVHLQPYRIAAPPEPAEPDLADTYEALLRARAVRSRRVVTALCGAIAGLSIIALAEKPNQKERTRQDEMEIRAAEKLADAREAIENAELLARAEQATFSTIMGAMLDSDAAEQADHHGTTSAGGGASALGNEGRPCNIVLPKTGRLVHGKATFPLLVVANNDRDLPSPSIATLMADIRRAEEHLHAGRMMEAILYGNALSAQRLRYDIIVATTTMKHPVVNTPTSYEPGEVTGRAYVYDFENHRVRCAGDVHAASSRNIEYTYPATAMGASNKNFAPLLDDDLEVQLQRAIANDALFKID